MDIVCCIKLFQKLSTDYYSVILEEGNCFGFNHFLECLLLGSQQDGQIGTLQKMRKKK